MSWVANVLLMYSVGEEWIENEAEEIEYIGTSSCLIEVNRWLREQGWVDLLDLVEHIGGMKRHGFEAVVWGAALNHLDIETFLSCVKRQAWREPENVQILIKDQMDEKFILYSLSDMTNLGIKS